MRFWVGVTDNKWYDFLAHQDRIDEVNFWHPSGKASFTDLGEGTLFLFKLRAPHHHFAGGGYFVKSEPSPLPLAWDAFGVKNGAATYRALQGMIGPLRSRDDGTTPEIGCTILAEPCFWPRSEWIPADGIFDKHIMSGKYFDSADEVGGRLWAEAKMRMDACRGPGTLWREPEIESSFGSPRLVAPRRGQGAFKVLVTNAYQRRCAITGERTLPVLEAAHIKPFSQQGLNNTYNGLLLRADFHKLFDVGLVTVTPEYRVEISQRIKEEWYNGKAYFRLHGEELASLPQALGDRPRQDLLAWHNENVFEKEVSRGN